MKKAVIIISAFCFGLAAAVTARLLPAWHSPAGHGAHSGIETVDFDLRQQPLHDMSGQKTTLAAAQDAPLLVNFWATWCAPCVREMSLLQQAQQAHAIPTIGITYEDIATIKAFARQHPVDYPLYRSGFDIFYFFQQQGNRTAVLPYTVLLDSNGQVLDEKIGDFKTVEEIAEFARQSSARL